MSTGDAHITAAVRERADDLAGFVSDLVRYNSTNPFWPGGDPDGEDRCQQALAARLADRGFDIDLWEPDPDRLARYAGKPGHQPDRSFVGRPDLGARLTGQGQGNSVLLSGHVDVVGAGDPALWSYDPFGGVVSAGAVHGRGSVDMKGGLAAMLFAVETLQDLGLRPGGDILWGSVVDEETGGMGTLALVDRGYRADAGIVAEGTGGRVAAGCRGILWGAVHVPGRPGHIELPQQNWHDGGSVDAIGRARNILQRLDEVNKRWATDPDKQHPLLEIPNQICVAQFNGGEHPTSWAGSARIVFDAQYLPQERDEHGLGGRVAAEIEAEIAKAAADDPWLASHPPTVEWLLDADCAEIAEDHPWLGTLTASASAANGHSQPILLGAHADSSLLTEWGTPTVVLGPGTPYRAHQIDEHVAIDELVSVAQTYATALAQWGHWRP